MTRTADPTAPIYTGPLTDRTDDELRAALAAAQADSDDPRAARAVAAIERLLETRSTIADRRADGSTGAVEARPLSDYTDDELRDSIARLEARHATQTARDKAMTTRAITRAKRELDDRVASDARYAASAADARDTIAPRSDDPITVKRSDVLAARSRYAKLAEELRARPDAPTIAIALGNVRRLTDLLGGLRAGDYVIVDHDDLDGLPISAPSDRWSPVDGAARLRVTAVGRDGNTGIATVAVRRPDGGESDVVKADDATWCL